MKKAFFIIIILAVAAGALGYIYHKSSKQNTKVDPLSAYHYTEYKTDSVVPGFPSELLDNSTKVIESFSADVDAYTVQHTVKYETSDSVDKATDFYKAYFKANAYTVHDEKNNVVESMQAVKGSSTINLSININPATKTTFVVINYAEAK